VQTLLLSGALLSLGQLALAGSLTSQEAFRQIRIQAKDQYVTSGAWSPSGLLLLNLAENRLERIRANGALDPLRPFDALAGWVRPLNEAGDLMVQMRNPDEWWAIRVGAASEWAVKARWGCDRCSIAHWAPLNRERILGVGEVREERAGRDDDDEAIEAGEAIESAARDEAPPTWRQGLFWIGPKGPELAYGLEDEHLAMYLLGLQWVAVANGQGYAIVPEPEPDATSSKRFLQVIELPPYNRSHRVVTRLPIPMPEITAYQNHRQLPEAMAQLSRQRIPMALVGWRENLYLVEKSAETVYLWHIDTRDGGLHFLNTLPASDFATVIPGREWALLRKGPLLGFGRQQIQSLVLFPSEPLGP